MPLLIAQKLKPVLDELEFSDATRYTFGRTYWRIWIDSKTEILCVERWIALAIYANLLNNFDAALLFRSNAF